MTNYLTEQAITANVLNGANGTTVRVYDFLRNAQALAEKHGRAWITPRVKTIAEQLGRCDRSIRRALASLRQRGAITVQSRFYKDRTGKLKQISNRIRVITTVEAVLSIKAKIIHRAKALWKYRADIPVTPGTQDLRKRPPAGPKHSDVYRQLMLAGLKKGP